MAPSLLKTRRGGICLSAYPPSCGQCAAVQSAQQNEVREASRHINDCGGFGPKTDANFLRLGIRKPSFISTPALDAVQTNGMRTRSSHAVVPYR